jgi:hypothetical protein
VPAQADGDADERHRHRGRRPPVGPDPRRPRRRCTGTRADPRAAAAGRGGRWRR